MMPELDGPETCRRLKSDPATAAIPVIFLTAKSQEAEIQRGLSLGAAGYVTKPFDALTLGQHVKDIVSKIQSVKIRTRAFVVLWLITILVAGTIGFIVYALNVASGMDAERQRLSESSTCTARCGARWSSSSTISMTWRVLDLPSIARAPAAPSGAPSTTTSRTRPRWFAIPISASALQQIEAAVRQVDGDAGIRRPARSDSPEVLLTLSETRLRADRERCSQEFDGASASCGRRGSPADPRAGQLFFTIVASIAVLGMLLMACDHVLDQAGHPRSAHRADRVRAPHRARATSPPRTRRCGRMKSAS